MKPNIKGCFDCFHTMKVIYTVSISFNSVGCLLFLHERTITLTICLSSKEFTPWWEGDNQWRFVHWTGLDCIAQNLILRHPPNYTPDIVANIYPFRLGILPWWAQLCFQARHRFICLLLFADLWLVWASRKCGRFYLSDCHSFIGWKQRGQQCLSKGLFR